MEIKVENNELVIKTTYYNNLTHQNEHKEKRVALSNFKITGLKDLLNECQQGGYEDQLYKKRSFE